MQGNKKKQVIINKETPIRYLNFQQKFWRPGENDPIYSKWWKKKTYNQDYKTILSNKIIIQNWR